jgi:hypothetical protein
MMFEFWRRLRVGKQRASEVEVDQLLQEQWDIAGQFAEELLVVFSQNSDITATAVLTFFQSFKEEKRFEFGDSANFTLAMVIELFRQSQAKMKRQSEDIARTKRAKKEKSWVQAYVTERNLTVFVQSVISLLREAQELEESN